MGALNPVLDSISSSSLTSIVVLSFGLLITYLALEALYNLYLHPLSKYPGPKLWAISRIPWSRALIRGDYWIRLAEIHETYGVVVRIAPDEISTVSPSAWRDIYVANPLLLKDQHVQTPPLNGAHSLFTAEGDTHRRIRGSLASAFSDKALKEQSLLLETYADRFVTTLRAEVANKSGRAVDIDKWFGHLSLDVVSELAFGEPAHLLESPGEASLLYEYFAHGRFSTVRGSLTRYRLLFNVLSAISLRLTAPMRKKNWQISEDVITRRLARGAGSQPDLASALGGKFDETATKGLTRKELIANALAIMIVNSQLVTNTVADVTYFLAKYPEVLKRVQEEIAAKGFAASEDIVSQSTDSLPYLKAVLDETLRVHHPSPISLPRVVLEDRVIDGELIPAKSIIGINVHTIAMYSANFTKPKEFYPERFLPTEHPFYDPIFKDDNKAAFKPFSIGPRNCIGERILRSQARLAIAKLVYNFNITPADGFESFMKRGSWLVFEPAPLMVHLTDRKPSP